MVTLEGIAIGIEPNFKVLSKAYPYVAKRLLTDPSEELRNSLRDLLFKEGSFRWNRLENLLNNARDSQDYDFDLVFNQATEFIFSDRGTFIREKLVNEIVNALDIFGRKTWFNVSSLLREQVGLTVQETPIDLKDSSKTFDHLKNISNILRTTPGFDPNHLVPLLAQLIVKPETQQLGQKVAEGLAQKLVARVIRNLLLKLEEDERVSVNINKPQLSLPTAAMK